MAKLIVAKDVLACKEAGQMVCHIEKGTIITPAAQDEAKKYGISFECCEDTCTTSFEMNNQRISTDEILHILKNILMNTDDKIEREAKPYRFVSHTNGMKVVRGSTVRMDDFDTGTPGAKVGFQELVGQHESKMSAGFLTIDQSKFAWKLPYEEIDYVISGTVTVEIDGQTFVAREGDVLFVPSGSNVVWGSPDNAKLFYTTYPSNWADLM
ncbi:cupin domain-containing protein [Streptococcus ruminantium]|uniref:Cupin domain-containing protein n=1 Tax=Streptococcus ruminantium TaxID=1917441 RepID=A0ABU1B5B0_9STRE|nr:cupin domain-containing protein [Streptococcus ruminantium]MDQ8758827.1 cupin domain-containing protein [Streptococcus ruminantium]MDQ8765418.1 cupin domain-containing protein [Streptococcus ruminantium]MDQ8768255.1 cupin domain-containing protein [Streptococcus ruminantium]MDQ8774665.1 cupin domain-containing protein [Streptococcus ruminantium]MDQ8794629.1 cupin domain-containing protein [Streptococcus ruminantium]